MLKTMEEKKLIYKKQDPQDKRSVRIFLTEDGMKKRALASKTVKYFNNEVKKKISEKRLNDFFKVIADISSVIEEINKDYLDNEKKQLYIDK